MKWKEIDAGIDDGGGGKGNAYTKRVVSANFFSFSTIAVNATFSHERKKVYIETFLIPIHSYHHFKSQAPYNFSQHLFNFTVPF